PPTAVSAIQESIWRDHQRWPGSVSLRMAMRFSGALDVPALAAAWEQVVDRHPLLRSVFTEADGVLTRRDGPRPNLAVVVLPGADLANLRERAAAEVGTLFDPTREPPARAALFRGEGVAVLAIALHHLAYDAITGFAIVEELRAAYRRLA